MRATFASYACAVLVLSSRFAIPARVRNAVSSAPPSRGASLSAEGVGVLLDGVSKLSRKVDLLTDEDKLDSAFSYALELIVRETSLLCPTGDGSDDILGRSFMLRHEAVCCSTAILEKMTDSYFRVTLTFELQSQRTEVSYFSDGQVEYIYPEPCTGPTRKALLENGYVEVSVNSSTVENSRSLVDQRLAEWCPDSSSSLAKVRVVHLARVQVVEGLRVNMVVELSSGALHQLELAFDVDGNVTEITRPRLSNESNKCDILTSSSFSWSSLEELRAVETSPANAAATSGFHFERGALLDSDMEGNGHISALTAAVPRASFLELEGHARRAQGVGSLVEYDIRRAHRACFPTDDAAVLSQGSCGSCWAFAALGALGDRHCLANSASMTTSDGKRHTLSVQQLLSCWRRTGCHGGHAHHAFMALRRGRLAHTSSHPYSVRCFKDVGGVVEQWTDSDCKGYQKMTDDDMRKPCACVASRPDKQPVCTNEMNKTKGFGVLDMKRIPAPGDPKFSIIVMYTNAEVVAMIQSVLFESGPVYAAFDVREGFSAIVRANPHSVYRSNLSAKNMGGHAIVMVGWGQQDTTEEKYWWLRNSWGVRWGVNGHYKHLRGVNDGGIEAEVVYPTIQKKEWYDKLEFSDETAIVTDVFKGVRRQLGMMKPRSVWRFEVKCSADCLPVYAIVRTLNASTTHASSKEAKCCCQRELWDPPKCIWVPRRELVHRTGVVSMWSPNRTCGRYDLGRGYGTTREADGSQCGSEVLGSHETSGFLELHVHSTGPKTFVAELDLGEHPSAIGKHDLQIKAKLNGVGYASAEQLYRVTLGKSGAPKKSFQLLGMDGAFDREEEVYEVQMPYGKQWKVRQWYVFRVTARCSSACTGKAYFEDLDASSHPRGRELLFMKPSASEDPTVVVWTAEVAQYPPGNLTLAILVNSSTGDQSVLRRYSVDMPHVVEGQGNAWSPMHTWVKSAGAEWKGLINRKLIQEFHVLCSKDCRLLSFSFEGIAPLKPSDVASTSQRHKVSYLLDDFPKLPHGSLTALIKVEPLHGGRSRLMRVPFHLGHRVEVSNP